MRRKQLFVGSAVAGCAVLGLASCGDDTTRSIPTTSSVAPAPTTIAQPGGHGPVDSANRNADVVPVVNALTALGTATGAVSGGQPFDLETETQGADAVFDTKVASGGNEFHVLVDASGHRVRSQQQARTPSDDIAKVDAAAMTAADALQAVSSRHPGASFDEMEIDTDNNGVVVWQISLARPDHTEFTCTVDARTGHNTGSDDC